MIYLRTDAPQFFSDLDDVLRLFYGDVQIALAEPGQALAPGDRLFEHRFTDADGEWTDLWRCEGQSAELSQPAFAGTPAAGKRARPRPGKRAL